MIKVLYNKITRVLIMACLSVVSASYCYTDENVATEEIKRNITSDFPADYNEDFRDPFWKIGYIHIKGSEPMDIKKTVASQQETIFNKKEWIMARCKYGGTIERGNKRVALINNQVVQKGDIIPISEGGKVYKVKVVDIETKSVKLALVE